MSRSRIMQSVNQGELFSSEPEQAAKSDSKSIFASLDDAAGASHQQVTRFAARLNASTVSDAEHKQLLAERQQLIDKRLDGTITRKESIRLQYIRWSLDRIEDAKHGRGLDSLEARIEDIEKVAEHLEGLHRQLGDLVGKANGRRR